MLTSGLSRGIVVAALVVVVATVMSAQQPAATPAQAGVPELLAEVRALRAELNHVAGSSMRMQLLVARLTLQEQRIVNVSRELAESQKDLGAVTRERAAMERHRRELENNLRTREDTPEVQSEMRAALVRVKETLAETAAQEYQLQTRENELAALLASEQDQWTIFNARLDELERALPAASR